MKITTPILIIAQLLYLFSNAVIDAFVHRDIKVAYPKGVEFGEFGKWEKQSMN